MLGYTGKCLTGSSLNVSLGLEKNVRRKYVESKEAMSAFFDYFRLNHVRLFCEICCREICVIKRSGMLSIKKLKKIPVRNVII